MNKRKKPFQHVYPTLLNDPVWRARQGRYEKLAQLTGLKPTRSRQKMGKDLEQLRGLVKSFGLDHGSWWLDHGIPIVMTEPYCICSVPPKGLVILELSPQLAPRAGGTRAFLCTLAQHWAALTRIQARIEGSILETTILEKSK